MTNLFFRSWTSRIANEIEPDLVRFGAEVITSKWVSSVILWNGQIRLTCVEDVRAISERATPPRLTQYNHWGQRIDQLDTSEAWKELKGVFFKEGIPGIFYERKYGEFSRIYGFAKVHMLVGDSHVVSRVSLFVARG